MNTSDFYFDLLNNLTPDNKLELISRLSDSLKTKKKVKEVSLKSLFGAFKSKKSAEEIIAELRAERSFGRQIEDL